MKPALKALIALTLVAFTVPACGNGGNTTNNVTTTTLGQELADLDKAYAAGLLNEKEYKEQREALLKQKR